MRNFEYKVIPSPRRSDKIKGVKGSDDKFAHTVENLLNEMAADGWMFVRAEMLPQDERSGLTGTSTQWRNLLIFRRDTSVAWGEDDIAEVQEVVEPTLAEPAVYSQEPDAPEVDPTSAEEATPEAETPPLRPEPSLTREP